MDIEEKINFSEWQEGFSPKNGVWQILDNDYDKRNPSIYYAKFENGQWGSGSRDLDWVKRKVFKPYPSNNNPNNPRKWRGRIKVN